MEIFLAGVATGAVAMVFAVHAVRATLSRSTTYRAWLSSQELSLSDTIDKLQAETQLAELPEEFSFPDTPPIWPRERVDAFLCEEKMRRSRKVCKICGAGTVTGSRHECRQQGLE